MSDVWDFKIVVVTWNVLQKTDFSWKSLSKNFRNVFNVFRMPWEPFLWFFKPWEQASKPDDFLLNPKSQVQYLVGQIPRVFGSSKDIKSKTVSWIAMTEKANGSESRSLGAPLKGGRRIMVLFYRRGFNRSRFGLACLGGPVNCHVEV